MTRADLYEFIAARRLAVLATISELGLPQAALVGIAVTDRLEIVFDTVKSSRKFRNLVANPAASFVIGWEAEATLQYEGEAQEISSADLGRLQAVYFAQFPDGPIRQSWPGITYFVVRPRWIRYSDFGRNPAYIEEFRF